MYWLLVSQLRATFSTRSPRPPPRDCCSFENTQFGLKTQVGSFVKITNYFKMKSTARPIRRRLLVNPLSHEAHVAFGFPAPLCLEPATESRTATWLRSFFSLSLLLFWRARASAASKASHVTADSEGSAQPRIRLWDVGREKDTHPQGISFLLFCAALDTSSSCLRRTKSRQSAAWAMFTASYWMKAHRRTGPLKAGNQSSQKHCNRAQTSLDCSLFETVVKMSVFSVCLLFISVEGQPNQWKSKSGDWTVDCFSLTSWTIKTRTPRMSMTLLKVWKQKANKINI